MGESPSSISRPEGHESSFSRALSIESGPFPFLLFVVLNHSFFLRDRHSLNTPTMRSTSVFVLAATALGLVDASNNFLTPYGALGKRQAFDPDESTGSGADCVEAFGEGYIECRAPSDTKRRLCINPDLGETCCESACMWTHLPFWMRYLTFNRGMPCRIFLSSPGPLLP